jgi:hypothetical protein
MTSIVSLDEAAKAARKILGYYPTIPASDPKMFAAGLIKVLTNYPQAVVDRAAEAEGIASAVTFLNLAEIRKHLDLWRADYFLHQERMDRSTRKLLPEPPRDPEADKRISEGFKKLSEHISKGQNPSHQ